MCVHSKTIWTWSNSNKLHVSLDKEGDPLFQILLSDLNEFLDNFCVIELEQFGVDEGGPVPSTRGRLSLFICSMNGLYLCDQSCSDEKIIRILTNMFI